VFGPDNFVGVRLRKGQALIEPKQNGTDLGIQIAQALYKLDCERPLQGGFLEPLESSAIVLIELSAKLIAEQMPPCREVMDIVAARFNDVNHYRWGRIIDFLKLHYVLTQRQEPFWRDNLDPQSVPDRLKNLLQLWKYQSPWFFDEFDRLEEVFPAASYQYVLYGMGFRTEVGPMDNADTESTATRLLRENAAMTKQLRSQLPKNRDLLRKIHEHGLQRI